MLSHAETKEASAGAQAEWPSVAVVIPCWNAEKWIGRAIQSVLDQNYPNLEIIIIDDGSTDGSLEIIKSFGDKVRWETGPNRGACAARNRGTELADAHFILFLDADDFLYGNYIASMAAAGTTGVDVIVGGYAQIDEHGNLSQVITYNNINNCIELLAAYLDRFIQTSAFVWCKEFLQKNGGWNNNLSMYQDADLAIRLLLKRPKFCLASLNGSFAVWHCHDGAQRITRTITAKKIESSLASLEGVIEDVIALDDGSVTRGLSQRYYNLAMTSYKNGSKVIGDYALARSRSLGLRGHCGGHFHRRLCLIFGLERKIKLTAWVRKQLAWLGFPETKN